MRLLGRAAGPSAPMESTSPPVVPPGEGELRGRGTAADGLVEAAVAGYGRLESLEIDPRLLRHGTRAIADRVIEAVRAAQDDELRQRQELLGGDIDQTAMRRQLEAVAAEAARGLDGMIGDLDALTRRLDQR
jgi:hypothetical protein